MNYVIFQLCMLMANVGFAVMNHVHGETVLTIAGAWAVGVSTAFFMMGVLEWIDERKQHGSNEAG